MFSKIIVHRVGNKINGEGLRISSEELEVEEGIKESLTDFFLKGFKSDEQFQFYSDTYLNQNPIYQAVNQIFEDPSVFLTESENIATHLFEITQNPRVQGGDLFVCYFEPEEGDETSVAKVGLFKTETKLPFLKIEPSEESFDLNKDYGIGLTKLDKGCVIYNVDSDLGYAVSVIDQNKNGDEYYWFEDFLKVKQRNDAYFHTQETLAVYKDFITKQLPQEFEISKADQADFLNKSISFFKDRDQFEFEDFTSNVLEDQNVIESFVNYKTDYEQDMQVSIAEDFVINESAVKKNARYFKSVIKLDKNFHIYVHGDRKLIETGQDEKGKYYRLYFEEEK
ncbi:nucleoid-associated protein [Chryseobacterium sp. A321]